MASYDNLMTMEPWAFRSTLTDNWFSDVFARETEALTKVLQKSLANHESAILPNNNNNADTFSPFFNLENGPVHTPTASGPTVSGGSENDISAAVSKRPGGVASRKIAKRKARASKRASMTTYITADAANFRQMVQQVTGIRIGGGGVNGHVSVGASAAPVLKPEAQRMVVNRLQQQQQHGGNCLPTLDTSAFLLEQQQQMVVDPATTSFMSSISHPTPSAAVDGGSSGFDFETYTSFPTLESWN